MDFTQLVEEFEEGPLTRAPGKQKEEATPEKRKAAG